MADKNRNPVTIGCTLIVTVIAIGGIFMACGAVTSDIKDNKDHIGILEANDDDQDMEIVNLRINAEKQQATADSTLNVLTSINTKLESVQQIQSKQATVQAVNSEKLKTLTKD